MDRKVTLISFGNSVISAWRDDTIDAIVHGTMDVSVDERFAVYARDGSLIPAGLGADPAPGAVSLAREAHRFVIAAATQLRPPCGRYNCHGLVFAARRAYIPPAGGEVDFDDVHRVQSSPYRGEPEYWRLQVPS